MANDIDSIVSGERTIEMKHPGNGALLGIRVSIMSITDPRMKKIRRQITDERLRLEARGKNFKADDIEDNRNKVTFSAMTGWEWYGKNADGEQITFRGTVPEFNRKNVYDVFDSKEWFRDQIDEEIGQEKDFFEVSPEI